jgi:hypothetical protein
VNLNQGDLESGALRLWLITPRMRGAQSGIQMAPARTVPEDIVAILGVMSHTVKKRGCYKGSAR